MKETASDVRTAKPITSQRGATTGVATAVAIERSPLAVLQEFLTDTLMLVVSATLYIVNLISKVVEYVTDAIVKIYRICLFCYRKPQHAKELVKATYQLLRVSYDAEIWSWSELWDVLKRQLIQPMAKAPPPPPAAPLTHHKIKTS